MEGEKIVFRDCKMLPDLYSFPGWDKYTQYEDHLFKEYIEHIKNEYIKYKGKIVRFKYYEPYNGRDEAFYHIICNKPIGRNGNKSFEPSMERSQRLLWCKAIIENEPCLEKCCEGIFTWEELNPHTNIKQTVLYLKRYRYIVILEERENYWLFITAYYVDSPKKKKKLDEKSKEIKQKTPHFLSK